MKTKFNREVRRRELVFPFELRASDAGTGDLVIEGYASVFDQQIDFGWFKEVVRKGAFTKTLSERDQVALWDHETSMPLARKSAGTLELKEDDHGLFIKAKLDPEIGMHADAYRHIKRGDVTGMSFGFEIMKETHDVASNLFEIQEVRLYEVSPCTIPAYEGTEIHSRCAMTEEQARAILNARGVAAGTTTPEPDPSTTLPEPETDHSRAGALLHWRLRVEALALDEIEKELSYYG